MTPTSLHHQHYCVDDENGETGSACGLLFSEAIAKTRLTHEADEVSCSNCRRWMQARGIVHGDREKLVPVLVLLDHKDRASLEVMADEANVTQAQLLRQLLRQAAHEREEINERFDVAQ